MGWVEWGGGGTWYRLSLPYDVEVLVGLPMLIAYHEKEETLPEVADRQVGQLVLCCQHSISTPPHAFITNEETTG